MVTDTSLTSRHVDQAVQYTSKGSDDRKGQDAIEGADACAPRTGAQGCTGLDGVAHMLPTMNCVGLCKFKQTHTNRLE